MAGEVDSISRRLSWHLTAPLLMLKKLVVVVLLLGDEATLLPQLLALFALP